MSRLPQQQPPLPHLQQQPGSSQPHMQQEQYSCNLSSGSCAANEKHIIAGPAIPVLAPDGSQSGGAQQPKPIGLAPDLTANSVGSAGCHGVHGVLHVCYFVMSAAAGYAR